MRKGNAKKGDVLGAARIAGIMAAKRTHELIPLCHPLLLSQVEVDVTPDAKLPGVRVTARVKVAGQTGVEMEALTAVSVACLTIYDMVKAVERGMRIEGIRLVEKSGGRTGHFRARGVNARGVDLGRRSARTCAGACSAVPAEEVPLAEAAGRVLASVSKRAAPSRPPMFRPWTAMRCAPAMWRRAGPLESHRRSSRPAGHFRPRSAPAKRRASLPAALCPHGADTVVVQELTKRDGDCVEVQKPTAKGRNVRPQGLDFRAGDKLFAKGHRLTARDLALAAGMNHPLVPVHRRPKVALFATGDELVPPGTEPGPGQIVYSNGFALAALVRAEGADVVDLGVVARQARRDDRGGAARPRSRRRYSGDHRRRFGRRL